MIDIWDKLKLACWHVAPAGIVILLIALSTVHLPLPGIYHFMPLLPIIGIYYWSAYKPDLVPYWLVFALGLLEDSMHGMPLGTSSLLFLLIRLIVNSQHRLFRRDTFSNIWIVFAALSFFTSLGYWLILSYYHHQWLGVSDALMQWGLTLMCYPLCHYMFNRVYFALPDAMRHAQRN